MAKGDKAVIETVQQPTEEEVIIPIPEGAVTMLRPADGRINHVAPENVQDYLDSGLWQKVETIAE